MIFLVYSGASCTRKTIRGRQKGFALVEVMVGLAILGVGLLSLAGLQMAGLKNNHDAYLRSQANLLAYDIVDRMRANRPSALNGLYDIDLQEEPDQDLNPIILNDLNEWKAALASLPGPGDGSVHVDAGLVTVLIQWDESRGEDDPTEFQIQSQL